MTKLNKEEEIRKEFREQFKGWILQDDQECYRNFTIIENHFLNKMQEERKRLCRKLEERQNLFSFVPEINGYKYIKAKDLDILSIINEK